LRGGPHDPTAVLDIDLDFTYESESAEVVVGNLSFRSALDTTLDARVLPPAIVSEAARDVLGAIVVAAASLHATRDAASGADH
jgi:hypothetical protein